MKRVITDGWLVSDSDNPSRTVGVAFMHKTFEHDGTYRLKECEFIKYRGGIAVRHFTYEPNDNQFVSSSASIELDKRQAIALRDELNRLFPKRTRRPYHQARRK